MQTPPPLFPIAAFCPRKKKERGMQQLEIQGQGLCSRGLQIQENCQSEVADSLNIKVRESHSCPFHQFFSNYLVVFMASAAGSAKAFILLLNSAWASSSTRCSPMFYSNDCFSRPKVRFWLMASESPLLCAECRKFTFDCRLPKVHFWLLTSECPLLTAGECLRLLSCIRSADARSANCPYLAQKYFPALKWPWYQQQGSIYLWNYTPNSHSFEEEFDHVKVMYKW